MSVAYQLDNADAGPKPVSQIKEPLSASRAGVLTMERIAPDAWDALAAQFRDVIHDQTQCFNAPLWNPKTVERFAFYKDGTVVGALLVRHLKIPLTGTSMTVSRWGPMWRKAGEPDRPEILDGIYRFLADDYARKAGSFVLLLPRADPDVCEIDCKALARAGFTSLPEKESPERYYVDVSESAAATRASMSQKWRYNLKKSEKQGLVAEFHEGEEGLAEFMPLYRSMVERKRFLDRTRVDWLSSLIQASEPGLRPFIVIVRKDGAPVAGAVIDHSGQEANYLYGATDERALGLKAGYFMQWAIIQRLAEDPKMRWYSLGGGTSPTCSLHQFKRGLVGKSGAIVNQPGFHVFAGNRRAALFGHAIVQLRAYKQRLESFLHVRRGGNAAGGGNVGR